MIGIPPGIAGSRRYAATVEGIANLVAYWRFTNDSAITDTAGSLHGTYDAAVTEVSGLPVGSDGAIRLGGLARGIVPTHASLDLAAFTLSFWAIIHEQPEGARAVLAREQSGLNVGDFGIYWIDGEFYAQFQHPSTTPTQHQIFSPVSIGEPHHVVVTANSSGFELWVDGRHIGTNTGFTGAWSSNGNDLQFGSAQQITEELDVTLDECAIWSRVLTDAEIIALAQRSAVAPIAVGDSFSVTEATTGILDLVDNDSWVGRRTGLTVAIVADGAFGNATARGDKSVDFAADSVSADEPDTFTYRITDATGLTSNTATVDVLVLNTASVGGGTLVYSWAPRADWIGPVGSILPLSSRDANDVLNINKWDESSTSGATVGGSLVINDFKTGGANRLCFNYGPRPPSGSKAGQDIPCLEIACPENTATTSNLSLGIPLYPALDGSGPRHMRIVFEVKTSKATDSTLHKPFGRTDIPTGDPYRNYRNSHEAWEAGRTATAQKYFIGIWGGAAPAGGLRENHWENPDELINTYSDRWQPGASGKTPIVYSYGFNRESNAGGWISSLLTPSSPQKEDGTSASVNDSGVHGVWHRIETEVFLCTPSLAQAANARRKATPTTRPSGGDGFVKHYWTRDIDGELGTPGSRVLLITGHTMIQNCGQDDVGSLDNMHTLLNLRGPWLYQAYGGSVGCQRDVFGWIRKIEVYVHD